MAPAAVCPTLRRKSRYSPKSRGLVSNTSIRPMTRSPPTRGMHSSLWKPYSAMSARSCVRQPRVVQAAHGHGLTGVDGERGGGEALDVEDVADDAGVQAARVGAHHAAQLVSLQREDVAIGGPDGVTQSLGQRREDRLEVVRLRGDGAEFDDVAQHGAPLLQLLEQACVLERAGQRLRHAAQEAHVLREVPLPRVVQVEKPEQLVADHQRQAHLAREAVVVVGLPFVLGELGVVGAGDGEHLVVLHGVHRRGVPLQVEHAAEHRDVVAAAVVARHADQGAALHAVDVAVGCVDRRQDALGHRGRQLAHVAGTAGQAGELHEFVQDAVAAIHLLEERGVLQGVRRRPDRDRGPGPCPR